MTVRPRPVAVPRAVSACWAAAAVLGALFTLIVAPVREASAGLTPLTLAHYLQRAAGPGARDVRVNGVYGSARDGAWQFTAHLTWRTAGSVKGGVVDLPQGAGTPAGASPVTTQRLAEEQRIGWTMPELARVTSRVGSGRGHAAVLELQISEAGEGELSYCAAAASAPTAMLAQCANFAASGQRRRSFEAELTLAPNDGPLSIRWH
jgi:hypothetical protein